MKKQSVPLRETRRLIQIVHRLRKECPWDRKQTHKSLAPHMVEEAFEAVEAMEGGKRDALREELGDVLLQVVLHAEIASEKGRFTHEDVAKNIADKMVRRHPHVFGNGSKDMKGHNRRWTELKAKEKPKKTLLEGIPTAMPALTLAHRYGDIAASVGFDWENAEQVLDKLEEELEELRVEIRRRKRNRHAIEMELGDVLFTVANLARHLKLNAERAAKKATGKFAKRFTKVEKHFKKERRLMTQCSIEELERVWQESK